MIRATLVYLFIGAYVIALAPPALLWSIWRGHAGPLFRLARRCIGIAGWLAGIRLVITGRELLTTTATCVFIANHQSNCDGPALLYALDRDPRALIKQEMMRLPLLSLVLRRAGFVPLDRRDAQQARLGIDHAAAMLSQGISFFAFPEGTRSRDGRLGEFKKGAFIMAIQAQVPIVPITINGSAAIQPRGHYGLRPGVIHVTIHPPVSTRGLTLVDRNALIQQTRATMFSVIAH